MRALLQRVSYASVSVKGQVIAQIGRGVLILLGVGRGDGEEQTKFLAEKVANLRIFEDEDGKTNLSILDVRGEAIVVSQFTLYADTRKGRRPSFTDAAPPDDAAPLVQQFIDSLRAAWHCYAGGKVRRAYAARNPQRRARDRLAGEIEVQDARCLN